MKRIILFCAVICLLTGCNANKSGYQIMNFPVKTYVTLPDYHNCSVPKEITTLTEDDLVTVINVEMTCNEWFQPIVEKRGIAEDDIVRLDIRMQSETMTVKEHFCYHMGEELFGSDFEQNLLHLNPGDSKSFSVIYTDDFSIPDFAGQSILFNVHVEEILQPFCMEDEEFICTCYGFDSMDEVKDFIRERTVKMRIFEYVFENLTNKVLLTSCPKQMEVYVERELNKCQSAAKDEHCDIETYIQSLYGISTAELKQEITDYFTGTMIMKAILENEGYTYSPSDYDRTIERLAKEANIEKEDIFLYYDDVSVWYELLRSDLENLFAEITVIE